MTGNAGALFVKWGYQCGGPAHYPIDIYLNDELITTVSDTDSYFFHDGDVNANYTIEENSNYQVKVKNDVGYATKSYLVEPVQTKLVKLTYSQLITTLHPLETILGSTGDLSSNLVGVTTIDGATVTIVDASYEMEAKIEVSDPSSWDASVVLNYGNDVVYERIKTFTSGCELADGIPLTKDEFGVNGSAFTIDASNSLTAYIGRVSGGFLSTITGCENHANTAKMSFVVKVDGIVKASSEGYDPVITVDPSYP